MLRKDLSRTRLPAYDSHIQMAPTDCIITTDKSQLDLAATHAFLSQTYWSPGIPVEVVDRAIKNSICFGVLRGRAQVGFARVVTDAHGLYAQFGFRELANPSRMMERWNPTANNPVA